MTKSIKNGNAGNVKVISQKGIIHLAVYFTITITHDSDALDEIEIISNVLNTWQMYKPDQFYELMKQQGPNMALLFNNIDGVSSNFESFSAELDLLEISFAAICLAETNLDTDQGNLYHPPGYKPVLQS